MSHKIMYPETGNPNEELISDIEKIRNGTNVKTLAFMKLLSYLSISKAKEQLDKIQAFDSKVIELNELLHMPTERTNLEILDEIEKVREQNNRHWMDVVRLCFELDEKRAQKIFHDIKECDKKIRDLSKNIVDKN